MLSMMLGGAATAPAPAEAEGTLNVYNWSDYIAEDTIAQLEAQTNIKLNYEVFDSNEILETKLIAGNTGYDIVVPSGSFLSRQVRAGLFQKLDKTKLPNWKNLDKDLMKRVELYDPGNQHGVIYLWGTTGIGYNTNALKQRLGDDYTVNTWALMFEPNLVSKLADCGVTTLDAPGEGLSAMLNYLQLNPDSNQETDIQRATQQWKSIRDHYRYFHSSQYINDLANGEICLAIGWSGDVLQARDRAHEADNGQDIAYAIPKEGALMWFDMMAIPVDAPNADNAHRFINFLLEPQTIAAITNYVNYANANRAATPFIDTEILEDGSIYPSADIKARLYVTLPPDQEAQRFQTRAWTNIRTNR